MPPARLSPWDHRLQAAAFGDNAVIGYEGIRADRLSGRQQQLLAGLIDVYVDRQEAGHAALRRAEILAHLPDTHFLWLGDDRADDGVFYYRVHSPVLWVEFDHQPGIAFANDAPTRHHVHTVVRTPNGNDYGRDLLRQHYERAHR